jgi:hypothetical protein
MTLEVLIDQLDQSIDSEYYFLALAMALSVPDIAAAIGSNDGEANGKKYMAWYDKWVFPRFSINVNEMLQARGIKNPVHIENPFTGAECYYYRCAMLHQARSIHAKSAFSRVMFIEPQSTTHVIHYGILNDALTIDLPSFCREVTQGYRDWVAVAQEEENYKKNIANTIQHHANGFAPYIVGVPVIS